jgi:hypothetical protein
MPSVLGADVERLDVDAEAGAAEVGEVEVQLAAPVVVLARRDRRVAVHAEAGGSEVARRLVGRVVERGLRVDGRARVDPDLRAEDGVAEPHPRVLAVVPVDVAGVDLDVVHPLDEAADVPERAAGVLELAHVRPVGDVEVPGLVLGAGPEARQGDARRVPRERLVHRRALEEEPLDVVAVDVADPTDDVRVEHPPVARADRGRVEPGVARRERHRDAAELDVLVRARVELAAADGGAGAAAVVRRLAPAAHVRPEVLVEAAVDAGVDLDGLRDLRVQEELDLGPLAVVAVAFAGGVLEVVEGPLVPAVAPEPLRVGRAADRELRALLRPGRAGDGHGHEEQREPESLRRAHVSTLLHSNRNGTPTCGPSEGRRLLGRPVRLALVGERLLLLFDLGSVAGPLAREDVHDVRVAVAVGPAAEAVLPLELVHLAGEEVGLVGEPFVRLDDDLVAPLRRVSLAELLEAHGAADRTAGAARPRRDEDGALRPAGLRLDLARDPVLGLRREDHALVPRVGGRERDVQAGEAFREAAPLLAVGVDEDEDHLGREAAAHPPRVLEGAAERDREGGLVARGLHLELDEVERPGLVDLVGRVDVGARALVVAGRVLERDLLGERGAGHEGDGEENERREKPSLHIEPPFLAGFSL